MPVMFATREQLRLCRTKNVRRKISDRAYIHWHLAAMECMEPSWNGTFGTLIHSHERNRLNTEIKLARSTATFKPCLKTRLLRFAYKQKRLINDCGTYPHSITGKQVSK